MSALSVPSRRLDPVADVEHAEIGALRLATDQREVCDICEKTFVATAIVTGEPTWCPRSMCHVVHRQLYCDFCKHVQSWFQACDADGSLHTGRAARLSKPGFTKGRKYVARFLTAHPEAAGVGQI